MYNQAMYPQSQSILPQGYPATATNQPQSTYGAGMQGLQHMRQMQQMQQEIQSQNQGGYGQGGGYYAKGGRLKRGKMVIAHFNPHELNVLDHLQGKRETCPRTGMRSYSHLEEVLKNPHILQNVVHHAAVGHASGHVAHGGHMHDYHNAKLNHLADQGVHGDTEVALIGPHTRNVFDHIVRATGGSLAVNPHSGHPHYGFLDGILGTIGKVLSPITGTIGKVVSPILGSLGGVLGGLGGGGGGLGGGGGGLGRAGAGAGLKKMAGQMAQKYLPQLGERFGGETGRRLASMGGDFLNQSLNSPYEGPGLRERFNSMRDAYNQGGFRGLAGQGLQQAGQMAGGQYGDYAQRLGQGLSQGQNIEHMARDFGGQALQDFGGRYGGQFSPVMQRAGAGLQQGHSPMQIARDVGSRAMRDFGGQYGNAIQDVINPYAPQQPRSMEEMMQAQQENQQLGLARGGLARYAH